HGLADPGQRGPRHLGDRRDLERHPGRGHGRRGDRAALHRRGRALRRRLAAHARGRGSPRRHPPPEELTLRGGSTTPPPPRLPPRGPPGPPPTPPRRTASYPTIVRRPSSNLPSPHPATLPRHSLQ